jgi:hypothetical protein
MSQRFCSPLVNNLSTLKSTKIISETLCKVPTTYVTCIHLDSSLKGFVLLFFMYVVSSVSSKNMSDFTPWGHRVSITTWKTDAVVLWVTVDISRHNGKNSFSDGSWLFFRTPVTACTNFLSLSSVVSPMDTQILFFLDSTWILMNISSLHTCRYIFLKSTHLEDLSEYSLEGNFWVQDSLF